MVDAPHTADPGKEKSDPRVGTVLAERYRLDRLLGIGGMGRVYAAEHVLMRKRLAVKVLHRELTRVPDVVARFEREAMAAANIDHPNIAAATDFGKLADGAVFLVLEYVSGRSLRDEITAGPMAPVRAIHIARQIASTLAAAHALNIVHRDLKPENVMLVEKGSDRDFVKVLDFGIAKVPFDEISERGSLRPGQNITKAGMVFGTPEYMAPEQALAQQVDGRADLYALGVILFEMLAAVRPFNSATQVGILGQQLSMPVPRVADRAPGVTVPPELERLLQTLLARDASERYATASEVVDLLEQLRGVASTHSPPLFTLPRGPGPLPSGPGSPESVLLEKAANMADSIDRSKVLDDSQTTAQAPVPSSQGPAPPPPRVPPPPAAPSIKPASSRAPLNTSRAPVNASRPPLNASRPPLNASRPPLNASRPPLNASRPPPSASRTPLNASRPPPSPSRPPPSPSRPPPAPSSRRLSAAPEEPRRDNAPESPLHAEALAASVSTETVSDPVGTAAAPVIGAALPARDASDNEPKSPAGGPEVLSALPAVPAATDVAPLPVVPTAPDVAPPLAEAGSIGTGPLDEPIEIPLTPSLAGRLGRLALAPIAAWRATRARGGRSAGANVDRALLLTEPSSPATEHVRPDTPLQSALTGFPLPAVIAGVVLFVAASVGTVVFLSGRRPAPEHDRAASARTRTPPASVVSKPAPARPSQTAATTAPKSAPSPDELAQARESGTQALRALSARYPSDSRTVLELAKSLRRDELFGDVTEALARVLSIDETQSTNGEVATLLWQATQKSDSRAQAFALLEDSMGTRGPDIAYDLVTTDGIQPAVKERAAQMLQGTAFEQHASEALKVAVALRAAKGCDAQRKIVARAEKSGDRRSLPYLQALQKERCLTPPDHKRLRAAIEAIQRRPRG
jgi:serine/threonine protein kinase